MEKMKKLKRKEKDWNEQERNEKANQETATTISYQSSRFQFLVALQLCIGWTAAKSY